jgi:hypothetical protein
MQAEPLFSERPAAGLTEDCHRYREDHHSPDTHGSIECNSRPLFAADQMQLQTLQAAERGQRRGRLQHDERQFRSSSHVLLAADFTLVQPVALLYRNRFYASLRRAFCESSPMPTSAHPPAFFGQIRTPQAAYRLQSIICTRAWRDQHPDPPTAIRCHTLTITYGLSIMSANSATCS